jgi:hypothetical protein
VESGVVDIPSAGMPISAAIVDNSISQKTKDKTTQAPEILLLRTCPKETKSACFWDTCTCLFITAQVTTVRIGNQCKWPSVDEWKTRMWYI